MRCLHVVKVSAINPEGRVWIDFYQPTKSVMWNSKHLNYNVFEYANIMNILDD